MLESLSIENYKSLHKINLDLPRFCTFVGANAAGKSNLADAFDFLRVVARSGLPAAVTEKGGYENICFRRARRARGAIRFALTVTGVELPFRGIDGDEFRFEYAFSFKTTRRTISSDYSVTSEELHLKTRPKNEQGKWKTILSYTLPAKGEPFATGGDRKKFRFLPPGDVLEATVRDHRTQIHDDLLLTSRLSGWPPFRVLVDYLSGLRVFQIMPSEARRPASASGVKEMGRNGENLPAAILALKRESDDTYEFLLEQLKQAVPSVTGIETDYVETKKLGLFLREEGIGRRMYASELSDGTLRTIAIFVPLIVPKYQLVVVEEPENCIHPWVVRQYVDACRRIAKHKQIILTSHSPVLVDELRPEELFIVERLTGETIITPAEQMEEEVKRIVLDGIMGLGEYWDSGALRGVPTQLDLFDEST